MFNNFKRIISAILVVAMLLCSALALASCGGGGDDSGKCTSHVDNNGDGICDTEGCGEAVEGENPPDDTQKTATYTVTVKTAYGMPLDKAVVYIHDEASSNPSSSEGRARVDKNGVATFTLDTSKTYSVFLIDGEGIPDGYTVEDKYMFDSQRRADIRLHSAPRTDETIDEADDYEVGDVIHDFSITDINGKTWKVSEVLKEQQMLLLNFWYVECSACVTEFPYMIKAYNDYNALHGNDGKNIVEIFAINDHADPIGQIRDFTVPVTDELGNTTYEPLSFPSFKAENSNYLSYSFIRKFFEDDSSTGYPVSVFIDRAGVICCIEVGAVTNAKAFTNAFDHFTAADYDQKLVDSIAEFTPITIPTVDAPTSDEIDEALSGTNYRTGEKIEVNYRFDDAELNWPYIITEIGGEICLRPSNKDIDNSYAILYADVYLEAGDALAFDYFSSTQSSNSGEDYMVLIVNGKDIYTISGYDGQDVNWKTCYTYVAQHSGTYELAFAYIKDSADYVGEDAVFIKNLRVTSSDDIDVETYIFRYAAENENSDGDGYQNYVQVFYNESDGYFHVGSVNGPLLLAQLVDTYTQFDRSKTVFERLYANTDDYGEVVFMIDGVNCFAQMEKYGNYASNSSIPGHVPVTLELREYLEAYVNLFRREVGESASENLWLQLCCYYDAYGNGVEQMEDPIKGLSTFSAYDAVLDTEMTVTYDSIVVPRGYLYKFVPTVSGAYRITSYADSAVVGWIFTTDEDGESGRAGNRILYLDSELGERIVPELVFDGYKVVCPNCQKDVIFKKEYDEHGAEVVIESVECSDPVCVDPTTELPTVITDLSGKEDIFSIDYKNISMAAYLEAGKSYYIAIAFHTVEELGSFNFDLKYIGETFDKFVLASPGLFTFEMDENGAMGETIAGGIDVKLCDVDGCADCADMALKSGKPTGTKYYHSVNKDGTLGYIVFADFHLATDIFNHNIVSMISYIENGKQIYGFDFTDNPGKSDLDREAETFYDTMIKYGQEALYVSWGTGMTDEEKDEVWLSYCMNEVILGNTNGLKDLEEADALIAQAIEWAEFVKEKGIDYLEALWGDDFDEKWSYYQMDDIIAGIYHGDNSNYTDVMMAYADNMLNEADHPERQGCLAVDEQLAHILQMFMDKHTFDGVKDSWIKFCYYYEMLGPDSVA